MMPTSSLRQLLAPLFGVTLLLAASLAAAQPPVTDAGAMPSELVTRGHIRLSLAGAERILAAAQAKAKAMNLTVNIAIVDDGGHLLAFARMDGARPASSYTAMTKAIAAATTRSPTGPIARDGNPPNLLLNLSLQQTATAGGGKMTMLYGGVPIVVEDQIIGAVGVGGATGEQDAEIARAGIAALVDSLVQPTR